MAGGYRPVVILQSGVFNGIYEEKRIKAHLSSLKSTDDYYICVYDYSDFVDHNSPLETSNYLNSKSGAYDLTAKEAGAYPENLSEEECASPSGGLFDNNFLLQDNTVTEQHTAVFASYQESGSELNYVSWLEKEIWLKQHRIKCSQ